MRAMSQRRFVSCFLGLLILAMTGAPTWAAEARPRPALTGLNISGGEYGKGGGRVEFDYTYPNADDVAYVAAKGFTTVRVPFLWERVQPTLGGPLDAVEIDRLRAVVHLAAARGLRTILDVHNYARYREAVIGSPAVPVGAFASLWSGLATAFASEPTIIFGLMNEPHDLPTETWAAAAQAALDAIRAAGATQLVLVPGNDYSGAHSWAKPGFGTANAVAMRAVADPCRNMAFEFHQYLDADFSGAAPACQAPAAIAGTLRDATTWLRAIGGKGFLGEFGAGTDAQCRAGLEALLHTMNDDGDVWIGWTYWAAGRWWPPTYPLSVQPLGGQDRPQMATLQAWRGGTPPLTASCGAGAPYRAGTASAPGGSARKTLR